VDVVIFTPIRLFGEALCASLNTFAEIDEVHICGSPDRVADAVIELESDIVLFDVTQEKALVEARILVAHCPEIPIIAVALPEIAQNIIECADAGFTAFYEAPVVNPRAWVLHTM
jgi:DNA-binding NarL/FixJ family response regulator